MSGIEAYDVGRADGVAEERQRIRDWVESNRRAFEIDDGVFFYRDSFNSEDLLNFIDGKKRENEETTGGEQS
jgi:hypothetical protein